MIKAIFLHNGNVELLDDIGSYCTDRIHQPSFFGVKATPLAQDLLERIIERKYEPTLPFLPNPKMTQEEAFSSITLFLRELLEDDWECRHRNNKIKESYLDHGKPILLSFEDFFLEEFGDEDIFHVYIGDPTKMDDKARGVFINGKEDIPYLFSQLVSWIYE